MAAGAARAMLMDIQPDAIVHLAAMSGGIAANANRPADFFYDNLSMTLPLIHEAYRAGVIKLLALMGSCAYPATAAAPISEGHIWDGFPQPESAGYAMAKKMLLVQSWAYRRQYGFNSVVLIPGNVYGEWDNFNLEQAHVIPALVRKFVDARESGRPAVVVWGTGQPRRDFVYAGDVARTIPWFLANYSISDPVNISTGTSVSIRHLAETIKDLAGYRGSIEWDTSRPDGQADKVLDVTRLHELGLRCTTPLTDGLRKTMEWYLRARQSREVRL